MGDRTGIAWTDSTWSPVTGCSHVSDGCRFCYAETLSLRFGWSAKPWTAPNAAENVVLHPERLEQPLHWQKPRRVFVNSMSDLFHEQVPDDFIERVWGVMAVSPRHTFQILTKRPERMRALMPWLYRLSSRPLRNVWLGVSIEQDRWCSRADLLRDTPAAVRFISAEPLLEPLPSLSLAGIDWLSFGGESGHNADERSLVELCRHVDPGDKGACRYCHGTGYVPKGWAVEEARRLLDMCRYQTGATAFFLKQWGGITPKSGGNLLDGRTWEEFPAVAG